MLSVIIPTLNEEKAITPLLDSLNIDVKADFEVIIVDGGSIDRTASICSNYPFQLIASEIASRAAQMNLGAKAANGDILYFVHADTIPPKSFVEDIKHQVASGYSSGCYRFKFLNKPNPLLFINDFFTRFPYSWCRGGDQTFYIKKLLFDQMGGYNEDFVIMEDFELYDRIQNKNAFKVIPKSVHVSARKYERNPYLKVQFANYKAMKMYRNGTNPQVIKQFYTDQLQ